MSQLKTIEIYTAICSDKRVGNQDVAFSSSSYIALNEQIKQFFISFYPDWAENNESMEDYLESCDDIEWDYINSDLLIDEQLIKELKE